MNQDPISTLVPEFIESLKKLGRSPSTLLAYRSDLTQLVDYLKENNKFTADQTKHADLERFRDHLLNQKYTPKSTSRKLNAIKTFFRWLKDEGKATTDPSKDVSHPKIEITAPKYLSHLEFRALRDAVRGDNRMAAIVEVILQAGVRISEIANLKTDQIKVSKIIIEAYATQPTREIPLNEAAREAIELYLSDRPKTDSPHLFVSKNGKPLAVRNIRAAIDRHMQRAEIPGYSVNDLRTTFIVENLRRGVDLITVSQAAGHKRLSTTERYMELADVKESGKKQRLEIL